MPRQRGVLQVKDKYTGDTLAELPQDDRLTLREKVHRARQAKDRVRRLSLEERLALMQAVGERLERDREELTDLVIHEGGQPRKFASMDVSAVLGMAPAMGQVLDVIRPQELPAAAGRNYLVFEPFGVVGIMAPRNAPFTVPLYCIFSSFGSGNATVIKPSGVAPLSTQRLLECCEDVGIPEATVLGTTCNGEDTAWEFVENPEVDAFLAYASSPLGKDNVIKMGHYLEGAKNALGNGFYSIPGKMKKYVPELAGNDPLVVLPGADLDRAAEAAVVGGFANSGQLCISAKRFLVHRSFAREFRERVCEEASRLKVGDPNLPDTDIGPLGRQATLDIAVHQMQEAVARGGKILSGGRCEEPFFYPTIVEFDKELLLNHAAEEKPSLWTEESFAPLRSLVVFDSYEEAVSLANDSIYGLGASIFGEPEKAREIAGQLEGGRIIINESPLYLDPHLPVGGIKDSGLYGCTHKIQELVYAKRVHVGG